MTRINVHSVPQVADDASTRASRVRRGSIGAAAGGASAALATMLGKLGGNRRLWWERARAETRSATDGGGKRRPLRLSARERRYTRWFVYIRIIRVLLRLLCI